MLAFYCKQTDNFNFKSRLKVAYDTDKTFWLPSLHGLDFMRLQSQNSMQLCEYHVTTRALAR